jgi:hypothetical protein
MQFEHSVKVVIKVESSKLDEVLIQFLLSLGQIFGELLGEIMLHYAFEYSLTGRMGEILGLEDGDRWHWKSKKGYRAITINTLFGKVKLPNPVVEIVRSDGRKEKRVLGRKLLEVSPYYQIPDFMKQILGSLGSLMSFRSVRKSMLGLGIFRVSLHSIWRSVSWLSSRIILPVKGSKLRDEQIEVDGTGVKTLKSGKRGSEAKIVMQRNESGGLTFLGVKVGKYGLKSDWEELLAPLKNLVTQVKRCILIADGDETPITVWQKLNPNALLFFQRCLWHIPRQLKYVLWQDKASKNQKIEILTLCYNSFKLRKNVPLEEFADYISLKLDRIDTLIARCKQLKLTACASFLLNAKDFAFTLGRNSNDNHNTSKTERAMRTINQRTAIATSSESGVQNIIKIRLNLFYNHQFKGLHFHT